MNNIIMIQEYVKIGLQFFGIIFIVLKWNDIKYIFCETDGKMSSKRVLSIMGMVTLCRLSLFVTNEKDGIDNNILLVLTVIILTASAIATFPQIMDLFGKIKSVPETKIDIKSTDSSNVSKTE